VVAAFLHPWSGTAIRHIPAGSRFDVLDTRFAGLAADNRWNEAGEPTFYLAGDLIVSHSNTQAWPQAAPTPTLNPYMRARASSNRLAIPGSLELWFGASIRTLRDNRDGTYRGDFGVGPVGRHH
jgi:hypothetical protein